MPSSEEPFVTIVRAVAHPGKGPELIERLREVVERDAGEPGTLAQTIQVEQGSPDVVWCYEVWASVTALEEHRINGADIRDRIAPLIAEPYQVITCTPLFGHGVDLAELVRR
jgi:quinol monooxygenase YgiN